MKHEKHPIRRSIAGKLAVLMTALILAAVAVLPLLPVAPALAAPVVYEAESATLSGGAATASDHTGYTGTGFVGGYTDSHKGSASTQFAVSAAAAGSYTIGLRYANATTATMSLSLYVNGTKAKQVVLPALANWDTWAAETETVTLAAGANTIAYKFDSSDSGNVNLDSLTVEAVPAPPVGAYEAENAALSGGASVATDHSGYSGSGFVAGYTDANKGSANTQFAVSVAAAGSYEATLRYANGTGSAMTLSLYVNGTKVRQTSLPALSNWDTWGTKTETVTLAAGSNTIAYKFDTTDSGNVNLDRMQLTSDSTPPSNNPSGTVYEAEDAFTSGSTVIASSNAGFTGAGYVTSFVSTGDRSVFAVNAAAGAHDVALRYANGTGASKTMSVFVNGIKQKTTTLAATNGWSDWAYRTESLTLRSGLNTIAYQYASGDSGNVQIDSITADTGASLETRGATVPYTAYEAEDAATNGTVLAANRTYLTVPSESSGRQAVRLTSTGQYVQFTAQNAADALVVRYSIPDAAAGGGANATLALYVNGTKSQDLSLSSKYAWVYGAYPYNNNPADGSGHRFYDEARFRIANLQPGDTIKLQKDANNTASSYTIDLIELEKVDSAYAMPANFIDIASSPYNAVGDGTTDNTTAIQSAINAAKSQGKGVWIPSGNFKISNHLYVDNVTIRGAGPWYSVISGQNGYGGFMAQGNNVQLFDFAFYGDVTYRDDANFHTAFEGNFGTGSLLQNLWIEHAKTGLWINGPTSGLDIVGLRIRDTLADGVNLHAGASNVRMEQTQIRNTGDDAAAMFSEGSADQNNLFKFNTIQLPLLANGIGIYGGTGNRAEDNRISDTVTASSGIAVSTRFNPVPFAGTTVVQRNTLLRTGGYEPNWNSQLGALWIYADTSDITAPVQVNDNDILDSTYQGILISYSRTVSNIVFNNDTIQGAGTYGIELNAAGSATFNGVTVGGAASGGLNNLSGYTVVRGSGNSGW